MTVDTGRHWHSSIESIDSMIEAALQKKWVKFSMGKGDYQWVNRQIKAIDIGYWLTDSNTAGNSE